MLKGEFDVDHAQIIDAAFGVATTDDGDGERRTPTQRRADALIDICDFYLAHHNRPVRRKHRPHLMMLATIDAAHHGGSGEYVDGTPLSAAMLRSTLCDCGVHRVVLNGQAEILDYGTIQYTVPDDLWNLVVARDRRCRFPGCDRKAAYCDAHHVVWYSDGGPTSLSNLVMLCRRHHRRLHRPGWTAKIEPDATLHVTDPYGLTRTTQPHGILRMLQ
jgi:hypothetical protein